MAENVSTETEITTPDNFRSDVWKVFGFQTINGKITDKEVAICRICKIRMKYHSSTSNLRANLMTFHPDKLGDLSEEPPLKQARITSFLPLSSSRGLPAVRQEAITDKLTRFICKDMRPINITQGSGFKDFIHELEPRYTVPSRTTITDRVVKLYDTTTSDK